MERLLTEQYLKSVIGSSPFVPTSLVQPSPTDSTLMLAMHPTHPVPCYFLPILCSPPSMLMVTALNSLNTHRLLLKGKKLVSVSLSLMPNAMPDPWLGLVNVCGHELN